MKEENYIFETASGFKLNVFKWLPESDPIAILLLVHGSVEHAYRYRAFAEFLIKKNIAVIAPDLRGHGGTAKLNGTYSFLAKKNGWETVIKDISEVKQKITEEYGTIPLVVFGHSMGSILVRDFISIDSRGIQGAIIMGSTIGQPILATVSLLLMKIMLIVRKSNSQSAFLHNLLYGKLNQTLKSPKTEVDFISRDERQVQKYLNDPLCGKTVTINYAQQLAKGSIRASKPRVFKKTPIEMPLLILSGTADPVGGLDAIKVKKLYQKYVKYGYEQAELQLYPGARHELLNETNCNDVMEEISNWINKIIA